VFVASVVNVDVREAMPRFLVHLELEDASLEKKKADRTGPARTRWCCEQIDLSQIFLQFFEFAG